jgi:hypothetical protein
MSDALFSVVHRKPTGKPFARPPFRYMYYYRTEVRNLSNRPLKIVWFEGYGEDDGHWYPGNILGRVLREREFSEWYTEGDAVVDGVIPPGKTAACDVNWHGSASPEPLRAKWAYIAVDQWWQRLLRRGRRRRRGRGARRPRGVGRRLGLAADRGRSRGDVCGASRSSPAPTP